MTAPQAPLDRELAWDLNIVLQKIGYEYSPSDVEEIAKGLTALGYSKTGNNDGLAGMVNELTKLKPVVDKIYGGLDGFLKGTSGTSHRPQ